MARELFAIWSRPQLSTTIQIEELLLRTLIHFSTKKLALGIDTYSRGLINRVCIAVHLVKAHESMATMDHGYAAK
jgi:hypothetical protein